MLVTVILVDSAYVIIRCFVYLCTTSKGHNHQTYSEETNACDKVCITVICCYSVEKTTQTCFEIA